VYLARLLIEEGHDVTLFTRGKKEIAFQMPDDSPEGFQNFKSKIKHIAGDRKARLTLHVTPKSGIVDRSTTT